MSDLQKKKSNRGEALIVKDGKWKIYSKIYGYEKYEFIRCPDAYKKAMELGYYPTGAVNLGVYLYPWLIFHRWTSVILFAINIYLLWPKKV